MRKEKQLKDREEPEAIKEKPGRRVFQEYSEAFVVAVILAIIIRALFVQAFKIPSGSMIPTLLIGDQILVSKFIYGIRIPFTNERWPKFRDPAHGDVIVFVYPEDRTKDFIKRVVGIGGDMVEIKEKQVYINGKPEHNPHARYGPKTIDPTGKRDNMPPLLVPEDHLFVMGDNRDQSHDSRWWGFVPVSDVKGEAFLIYYSANEFPGVRWGRIFNIIR